MINLSVFLHSWTFKFAIPDIVALIHVQTFWLSEMTNIQSHYWILKFEGETSTKP